MRFSPQQSAALDAIHEFMCGNDKRLVLAGYAGTGKTTLAKEVRDRYYDVRFCAYTGKAAQVLRSKGCEATTIHSAIYKFLCEDEESEPEFMLDRSSDLSKAALVIVDEYSMLNYDIIYDLELVAKKVLYLGDPFQLPPVDGWCGLKPDIMLDEVHRQALDSPVLAAATNVRMGRELEFCDDGDFMYLRKGELGQSEYIAADQIIVRKNETRVSWNNRYRSVLGYGGIIPVRGDKVICLQNNHEIGLYNGLIAEVLNKPKHDRKRGEFRLKIEGFDYVNVWDGDFVGKKLRHQKEKERFDFAYAITCHKAQGSEWDSVLVYKEGSCTPQWLYTAITRARNKCTVVY